MTAYPYNTNAGASKSSAVRSLEKVASELSKNNTPSVSFGKYTDLDSSDDYLDTAAAKYFQKLLLSTSTDKPIGASDINDLDTLNSVDNDLKSISDILTMTSSDKISKEDRQRYQKLLDYDLKNINDTGRNYIAKIYAARKELGIGSSKTDATAAQKENISKFKMTDILGISEISAATADDAKASLPSVATAINAVETQTRTLKLKIKKELEKQKAKTDTDDSKTKSKDSSQLQFAKAEALKVETSSVISQISGSTYSRKA